MLCAPRVSRGHGRAPDALDSSLSVTPDGSRSLMAPAATRGRHARTGRSPIRSPA